MLDHSVLNPMSPQGLAISNLFIMTTIIATLIVLGIAAVLVYTSVRFRRRQGGSEPPQTFGIVRLELVWTAVPTLILVVVLVVTVQAMRLSAANPPSSRQPDLVVVGHQWWWELRYPSGVVTANEFHIPVGKRFLVALKSIDVIHSLWVPQLGPKMDLVPGQTNHLWLEADRAGTYEGACTEFCGGPHAWMLIRVIAEPQAQFDAWQRRQSQPAIMPLDAEARQGASLFSQLTCAVCHPLGRSGTALTNLNAVMIGPDLTHVGSRQTLAAGRLVNTAASMAAWLHAPDVLKPGVHMPNLHLTPKELRAMTAYLESLR
ncbi:MAG: cytochrome c oxidase subunit II [Chloroflexota bacterium]